MDFIFHAVLGAYIADTAISDKQIAGAVFSTLPDLIGLTYYQVEKIKLARKVNLRTFASDYFKFSMSDTFFDSNGVLVYRSTHNLFAWLIATFVAWLLFGSIFWVFSLCYLSHLFIDSYTHKNDSALRPFFPFSDFKIEGVTWSSSPKVFVLHWLLLIVLIMI